MAGNRAIVSVGVVTWNSERDLPACLDGLKGQGYSPLELIVVDNASVDRSIEVVRRRWSPASIVENATNEGFCRPHNTAIRASSGAYYLALNPDVELQPGYIERLVSALESGPAFGSAIGKLLQRSRADPPLIDSAGLFLDRRRHQYLRGRGEPDRGQYDTAEEVFGADGAAPLYRRAMLEDVAIDGQVFDEAFFAYMEDVDLAWRARLLGWKCWYEPAATALHERTFQPGQRRNMPPDLRRMAVRNRYLTLLKNEGREEFRRDWWRILAYDLGIWAYILLRERSSLGAVRVVMREWRRARSWRDQVWGHVRCQADDRSEWFG